jgi:hypothetical protein
MSPTDARSYGRTVARSYGRTVARSNDRTDARSHGRTVARTSLWILLVCACVPVRLCAQVVDTVPKPHFPALVHYGKWATLGASVALGAMAHAKNQDAEAVFRDLRQRCFDTPANCLVGADGRYLDPESEALYGRTTRLDHQAARLLIGAEVSFAATAVGFVWELMHRKDGTPTIPFEPRVEQTPTATRIGLTFRF